MQKLTTAAASVDPSEVYECPDDEPCEPYPFYDPGYLLGPEDAPVDPAEAPAPDNDTFDLSSLDQQFGPFEPVTWTAPAEVPFPAALPEDTRERLTFRQVLLSEISRYRGWDNAVGDFLAGEIAVIAERARFLSADCPEVYRDHMAIVENCPEPC